MLADPAHMESAEELRETGEEVNQGSTRGSAEIHELWRGLADEPGMTVGL